MKQIKRQNKKTVVTHKIKHAVKMVLVPHKKNNYHPHLIRRFGLVSMAVLIIGLQFIYNFAQNSQVLGKNFDITVSELLTRTNWEREKAGVEDLKLNEKLNHAAELKVGDMFEDQYWAHISPSGETPWEWFNASDYDYSQAGENLAKNYGSAETVIEAWMNSKEHRENLLKGDYKDVGFAVQDGKIDGKYTVIVVAMYGVTVQDAASATLGMKTFATADNLGVTNAFQHLVLLIKSMSPATIVCIAILLVGIIVSLIAHHYRDKLPKAWKKSYKRHHGAFKAAGMFVFGLLVVIVSFGGRL
jgi:uncharacterized protein YkwD